MHNHNIHSLATVNYPTSPKRISLLSSSHQYSGNIQKLSIDNLKIFKDFFASRIVLAANHQHPIIFKDFSACRIVLTANHQYSGNIQRLSEQPATAINSSNQQQQSTAAPSNSNQQQQPATATSNSNQQQQPVGTTSNSNQQQQLPAATSSSNQQQQPAAATSNSNQHSSYQQHLHNQRRPPLVINTVPSRGYPASS